MGTQSVGQQPTKPPAPRVDPVDDPNMLEINTPTRSGWITRYVPR
jgi:hypothetical protein